MLRIWRQTKMRSVAALVAEEWRSTLQAWRLQSLRGAGRGDRTRSTLTAAGWVDERTVAPGVRATLDLAAEQCWRAAVRH
ncbi:hypothetical protein NDU88_003681 [Pleurodeles waltl]|uniref:Uncharacterized protein n=1 Tax=Pleurodeles waltl TaxID=8319 RepID=A0AAV7PAB2_PLEWA|nr:hypothetical protein NDU88_003681 [Pleurodeles waltl]